MVAYLIHNLNNIHFVKFWVTYVITMLVERIKQSLVNVLPSTLHDIQNTNIKFHTNQSGSFEEYLSNKNRAYYKISLACARKVKTLRKHEIKGVCDY